MTRNLAETVQTAQLSTPKTEQADLGDDDPHEDRKHNCRRAEER